MNTPLSREAVYEILLPVLDPVLHRKRILTLSGATLGVAHAARGTIHGIGQSLAAVTGGSPKHGIKQVDRFLSNDGIVVDVISGQLARWIVGDRSEVVVALDWTEYAGNQHSTVTLSLVTDHGRATSLAWKTVESGRLRGRRNTIEDDLLSALYRALGPKVRVTVLADRGFGDTKLYEFLEVVLGWDYIIRFRGIVAVESPQGERRTAAEWTPGNGRAHRIERAKVTDASVEVPAVVCVKRSGMKEAWHLATSRADLSAEDVVESYARRFTIEETFRDDKDDRFGVGLGEVNIGSPERRDRMLLAVAVAHTVLTLLGAAGEQVGLDARLRANTEKSRRTHSLFRQGRAYAAGVAVTVCTLIPLTTSFLHFVQNLSSLPFIGGPG
jgi:hypothetical protein